MGANNWRAPIMTITKLSMLITIIMMNYAWEVRIYHTFTLHYFPQVTTHTCSLAVTPFLSMTLFNHSLMWSRCFWILRSSVWSLLIQVCISSLDKTWYGVQLWGLVLLDDMFIRRLVWTLRQPLLQWMAALHCWSKNLSCPLITSSSHPWEHHSFHAEFAYTCTVNLGLDLILIAEISHHCQWGAGASLPAVGTSKLRMV